MGFCRKCDRSAMQTQQCYDRQTMRVLVRYTCLICGHVEFGQDFTVDDNGCEHPIFMTWAQWMNQCRQDDIHYMALIKVG